MLPKNWGEPMGVPAIFEKQIEIKLLSCQVTNNRIGEFQVRYWSEYIT
ncbi:MAG: hypothetical protein P8X89_13965 [Reinekea sp.]